MVWKEMLEERNKCAAPIMTQSEHGVRGNEDSIWKVHSPHSGLLQHTADCSNNSPLVNCLAGPRFIFGGVLNTNSSLA